MSSEEPRGTQEVKTSEHCRRPVLQHYAALGADPSALPSSRLTPGEIGFIFVLHASFQFPFHTVHERSVSQPGVRGPAGVLDGVPRAHVMGDGVPQGHVRGFWTKSSNS